MNNGKSYLRVSITFATLLMIMLFPVPEPVAGNDAAGPYDSLVSRPEAPPSLPPLRRGPALSKGKFLVAGRSMQDPRFAQTVILLIQHDSRGAMGVIINRPLDVSLSRALPGIEGFQNSKDLLYWGGPVAFQQVSVLFRSKERPKDAIHVLGDIYYSASNNILMEMADNKDRSRTFRVYAGYAGWAFGQLDYELLSGDWHLFRADAETIFEKNSSDIWKDLIIFDSGEQVFNVPGKP